MPYVDVTDDPSAQSILTGVRAAAALLEGVGFTSLGLMENQSPGPKRLRMSGCAGPIRWLEHAVFKAFSLRMVA